MPSISERVIRSPSSSQPPTPANSGCVATIAVLATSEVSCTEATQNPK